MESMSNQKLAANFNIAGRQDLIMATLSEDCSLPFIYKRGASDLSNLVGHSVLSSSYVDNDRERTS